MPSIQKPSVVHPSVAKNELGLDHNELTYRFSGRDMRLTDVFGEVVKGVLA